MPRMRGITGLWIRALCESRYCRQRSCNAMPMAINIFLRFFLRVLRDLSVLLTFNFLLSCKESEFSTLATFVFSRI